MLIKYPSVIYVEPVSSTVPKLPEMIRKPIFLRRKLDVSLLCPAQGYPAPNFR